MNYLGLMDWDPVGPSFMASRRSVSVPQNSFWDDKSPRLFSSNENMKCLRMCENFNFSTVAEGMYSSMTAINQPLTVRNRQGEEIV